MYILVLNEKSIRQGKDRSKKKEWEKKLGKEDPQGFVRNELEGPLGRHGCWPPQYAAKGPRLALVLVSS